MRLSTIDGSNCEFLIVAVVMTIDALNNGRIQTCNSIDGPCFENIDTNYFQLILTFFEPAIMAFVVVRFFVCQNRWRRTLALEKVS